MGDDLNDDDGDGPVPDRKGATTCPSDHYQNIFKLH
jgi:hypothetical protein